MATPVVDKHADFFARSASSRLQKEMRMWDRQPLEGFKHHIMDDNPKRWIIDWIPQAGTLYAGESYKIQADFPYNYPFASPEVIFLDPVPICPHVYRNGVICLDVLLKHIWSPTMSMHTICLSILSVFSSTTVKESPPDDDVYVNKISVGRTLQQTGWWFKRSAFSVKEIIKHPLDFHLCRKYSRAIKRKVGDKN